MGSTGINGVSGSNGGQWWRCGSLLPPHPITPPPSHIQVLAGSHNLSSPSPSAQFSAAAEVFVHPDYKGDDGGDDVTAEGAGLPHDLMLLRLDPPLTLGPTVQPLPLPETEPQAGESCTVMGYGSTGGGEGDCGTAWGIVGWRCEVLWDIMGWRRALWDGAGHCGMAQGIVGWRRALWDGGAGRNGSVVGGHGALWDGAGHCGMARGIVGWRCGAEWRHCGRAQGIVGMRCGAEWWCRGRAWGIVGRRGALWDGAGHCGMAQGIVGGRGALWDGAAEQNGCVMGGHGALWEGAGHCGMALRGRMTALWEGAEHCGTAQGIVGWRRALWDGTAGRNGGALWEGVGHCGMAQGIVGWRCGAEWQHCGRARGIVGWRRVLWDGTAGRNGGGVGGRGALWDGAGHCGMARGIVGW